MSSLCLCLTAATAEDAYKQYERNAHNADLVEIRVDLLNPDERMESAGLCVRIDVPVILTLRREAEGGRWGRNKGEETEENRLALLSDLLKKTRWDYVDLEHDLSPDTVGELKKQINDSLTETKDRTCSIIRSLHCMTGEWIRRPTSELVGLALELARDGDLPKLAFFCGTSRDLLALARLGLALKGTDTVIQGMGEYGAPSRILAQRLGSLWTYASGAESEPAAPGQIDVETLCNMYRFRSMSDETRVSAVVGNPVAHSQSPRLHNNWLERDKRNGVYLPIRSDDLASTLEVCDVWGVTGVSVTVPHKSQALRQSDFNGSLARTVGAANTLVRTPAGWWAFNTDVQGFLDPLYAALNISGETEKPLGGLRVLVIGAGGAARAAVHGLVAAGAEVLVLNRTVSRARDLAERFGAKWGSLENSSAGLLVNMDIAVQTSSAGMPPLEHVDPLPWWDFAGCSLVYDMIYEPAMTLFLKRARDCGVRVLSGGVMLEAQAALQYRLFAEGPGAVGDSQL